MVTQSALFFRSFLTLFVALFVNGPKGAPIIAQSAYILQVALTCFEFVLDFVKGPVQWPIRAPSALAHFSCFLHVCFRSFLLVFVKRPILWPIILVEELTCHKLKNTPFSWPPCSDYRFIFWDYFCYIPLPLLVLGRYWVDLCITFLQESVFKN